MQGLEPKHFESGCPLGPFNGVLRIQACRLEDSGEFNGKDNSKLNGSWVHIVLYRDVTRTSSNMILGIACPDFQCDTPDGILLRFLAQTH